MKNCLIPFFGTALLLMACGDEVTNISEYGGADTVKAFKDLGKCDKSAIGKFVYVSESVARMVAMELMARTEKMALMVKTVPTESLAP